MRNSCHLDKDMAEHLHKQGICDSEIADRCGVKASTVYEWRRRHGIPVNPANKTGQHNNDKKRCAGCAYWRGSNGSKKDMHFCHHLLDTNKRRVVGENGECLSYHKSAKLRESLLR